MKKLLVLTLVMAAFMAVNAQIEINSTGKVGIGKAPNSSYHLSINGTTEFDNGSYTSLIMGSYGYNKALYPATNNSGQIGKSGYNFYRGYFRYLYVNGASITASDERLKKNKKELKSSLEKIKKLKGYSYDLLCEDTVADNNQIGFLAQELMEVYPEMLTYDSVIDQYGVNYIAMIPVLLEAIKEQGEIIDDLAKAVAKDKSNQKSGTIENNTENTLEQNTPNPFTKQTTVNYTISDDAINAMLCIYDLNGTQLRCYEIFGTGTGSQIIAASELNAGMYLYSLIVNGELIDTKRMVLTE